ncbi:MAG: hypothetical protein L6Q37_15760 [Bdellovibrionaceae bacterium]|nr:hypothetical protein [Pseudobdellovibrionaceae bacterium]NUM60409.1 hypothetical protein [Pseudobdellovibrionaceae bacterium]
MKIILAILAVCTLVYFIVFWINIQSNPKLVAVAGLDKKIVFWKELSAEEKAIVYEAYELTKSELSKTLELRKKARNNSFANEIPGTIYIVAFKESLFLLEDNYPYKAPGLEVPGKSLVNSIEFNKATKTFMLKTR